MLAAHGEAIGVAGANVAEYRALIAVREAAEQIGPVVFTWVPAEANGRAHALVAEALSQA